jgi:hypothetical protein
MPMPFYMRRYTFRILGFGLVYALLLVGALTVMRQPWAPRGGLAYLLAILPALPVIGMIWTIGRLMIECDDEYQRYLFVKQTLIATGLTLAIATAWGFLENFELAPHLPGYHVTVLWFAMIGVGGCIARWRA